MLCARRHAFVYYRQHIYAPIFRHAILLIIFRRLPALPPADAASPDGARHHFSADATPPFSAFL